MAIKARAKTEDAAAKSPWPTKTRRREVKFTEKRDAVYRAAARLFRERGFDDTSLGELADILNVTKPTVYYYVQSKDELLFNIKSEAQRQVIEFVKEADKLPGSGYDRLRAAMISYAELMMTDLGICLSIVPSRHMEPENRRVFYEGVKEVNRILMRIIRAGVKDGTLVAADPALVIRAQFGSLNWIGMWFAEGGRLSHDQLAAAQVDILLNGIRKK
jgi:AcrR family transcriptional regulator